MLLGDWPHHMPLQNMTAVFASEKLNRPSLSVTLNTSCMISAMSIGVAPLAGFNLVHGTLIALGIVPLVTQSGVRESITMIEESPSLIILA